MKTPVGAAADAGRSLYGVCWKTINRRALIGGLAALALPNPATATRSARSLWWRGTARLIEPTRTLDLTVETRLDLPQLAVRSTSFVTAQGSQSARTLNLSPEAVWLERGGTRTDLPAQLGVHERQQYAMYGWLLRVLQGPRPKPGRLALSAPPWPDIAFDIGLDGYPRAAEWTVADAEDGKLPIAERVVFSGRIGSDGLRWPRRFELSQRGKAYFILTIDAFRAT